MTIQPFFDTSASDYLPKSLCCLFVTVYKLYFRKFLRMQKGIANTDQGIVLSTCKYKYRQKGQASSQQERVSEYRVIDCVDSHHQIFPHLKCCEWHRQRAQRPGTGEGVLCFHLSVKGRKNNQLRLLLLFFFHLDTSLMQKPDEQMLQKGRTVVL